MTLPVTIKPQESRHTVVCIVNVCCLLSESRHTVVCIANV